jgi:hypothetical protein
MQGLVSNAERYRIEADKCAELAKSASPAFLAEILSKDRCSVRVHGRKTADSGSINACNFTRSKPVSVSLVPVSGSFY